MLVLMLLSASSVSSSAAQLAQTSASSCFAKPDCGSCISDSQDTACFCAQLWRARPDYSIPTAEAIPLCRCTGCYSTGRCMEASFTNGFGGCEDLTIDAVTCDCRPSVYTSCDTCASAAHPLCVWMDSATVVTSLMWTAPSSSKTHVASSSAEVGGRCTNGNGFIGPMYTQANITFFHSPLVGTLAAGVSTEPNDWFWAQCSVPQQGMALIVLGACVLAAVACVTLLSRRRRISRARQIQLPVGNYPLLVGSRG